MRLMWWNTYRLGGTTVENRKAGISASSAQWGVLPDTVIMCELTQQATDVEPKNYTYRHPSPQQLCYGIRAGADGVQAPATQKYTPLPGRVKTMFKAIGFKGRTDFKRIADRAPGMMVLPDATLYFFHAPSGNSKAIKAVSYLACDLDQKHGDEPWALVGDLNIQPDKLQLKLAPLHLDGLIKPPDRSTYESRTTFKRKMYDYALSNIDGLIVTVGNSGDLSDHQPILVSTTRGRGKKRGRSDDEDDAPNKKPKRDDSD